MTMTILHAGDFHYGDLCHSQPDPASGLPSALLSVDRCVGQAVDLAIDRQVDGFIAAGDIFHTPNPDSAALGLFARQLHRLGAAGVQVLLLAGNHERAPFPGRPCVLDVFADLPMVRVSTRPEIIELAGLKVATLPSVSRHHLIAQNPGASRALADEAVVDGLRQIVDGFRAEDADILTLHWPIAGSVLGSERDVVITQEPMLMPADVEGPWSYVAAGHIHKEQAIRLPDPGPAGSRLIGAYSGSIDRRNFGEEHERKVALLVYPDGRGSDQIPDAIELPARRFTTVKRWEEADVGQFDGAIVRVLDCEPDEQAHIQKAAYAAGAAMVRTEPRVNREATRRAEAVTETLGPLDALEEWLRVRDVPEEDRPSLRDLAKGLIEEAS